MGDVQIDGPETPAPAPTQPTLSPQPQPPPAPVPAGDCVSRDGAAFAMACAQLAATCDLYSFCKRVPAGDSLAPQPATGACVSNDPSIDHSAACQALEASCELHSFCKRAPALAQGSGMASARPRQNLRHVHRVLLQQGVLVRQRAAEGDEASATDLMTAKYLSDVSAEL